MTLQNGPLVIVTAFDDRQLGSGLAEVGQERFGREGCRLRCQFLSVRLGTGLFCLESLDLCQQYLLILVKFGAPGLCAIQKLLLPLGHPLLELSPVLSEVRKEIILERLELEIDDV